MKLLSIQFCNFRQFYGKTPRLILASGERNTTIFHGNNGSGKTSITNGFTWVLYEKFSAAFAAEDQLVNKRAIAETPLREPVECFVEIHFEHGTIRYRARRTCRAYATESGVETGNSLLNLQYAREDGRWFLPQELADDIIGRILPESLHRYFFFDGERIEKLMRDDKRSELADATKALLGINAIGGGVRHLNEVRKSIENHLKGIGNPQTKKFIKQKQEREAKVEQLEKRNQQIEDELKQYASQKHDLNRHLLELQGAENLQLQRSTLEEKHQDTVQRIQQTRAGLADVIATKGYTILLGEMTQQFRGWLSQRQETGELRRGIQRSFVEQLLKQERCICGAELHPGSPGFENVQQWTEKAAIADIEETAIRLSSQVDDIDAQAQEFCQTTQAQQQSLIELSRELSSLGEGLESVKQQLRSFPDQDIQELQQQLDHLELRSSELNQELGANQQQRVNLQREITQLGKDVDQQQMNERKQLLAQRRIAAVQEAMERLQQIQANFEQRFRESLEERIQALFRQISFTPYIPILNENYELSLIERTAGRDQVVAASTGENQILSLSFIGGIIDGVRSWSQRQVLVAPNSSTYPVVMDSPFGSLDEMYRRQVAKSIPQLANQLVVLVTKTQWRGEVETEMGDRIGREYVLRYNSPKPDCDEDAIERFGVRYPLVCRSPNEYEYTEIVPVEPEF
ncbi:AAA family ATPase [Sodalinema gerasimenkoae]|uniref:AAA family ATPase n=1 Tax=Sodalinema gerasimenkoae TaxID=2862348 RepID=UPI00135CDE75|nr:AAA family ATPase [Sodalinema gerasimenkoae]